MQQHNSNSSREEKRITCRAFTHRIIDSCLECYETSSFLKRDFTSKNRLFSTKFIEDLDYEPKQYQANPKPLKPRLLPSDLYQVEDSVRREAKQPQAQPRQRPASQRNPQAEEYIRQIKSEATEQQPVRNYDLQPIVNAHSVDLAEKLLHEEVERMTRQVAAEVVGREMSQAAAYEKPLYDKVVDFAQNEMLRQIAEQVLAEERDKARGKDQAAIKKVAQDELVTNLMLDHMLDKMAQHGRASAENEDIGKILDGEYSISSFNAPSVACS